MEPKRCPSRNGTMIPGRRMIMKTVNTRPTQILYKRLAIDFRSFKGLSDGLFQNFWYTEIVRVFLRGVKQRSIMTKVLANLVLTKRVHFMRHSG